MLPTLSLDELVFKISIIGANRTLPIYISNQLKFSSTPEVNALATMMLLGTLAVVGVTFGALRLVKVLATVAKRSKQVEEVEVAEEAIEHRLLVARARDV